MKNIVGQQLKILLDSKNISQERFAQLVGVGSSKGKVVNNWIHGRSGIPLDRFYRMLDVFPDLNLNWLFMDKGERFLGDDGGGVPVVEDSPVRYNNCIECRIKDGKIEVLDRELVLCRAEVSCLNQEVGRLKRSNGEAFRNENERNLSVGKKPKRYPNVGGGK